MLQGHVILLVSMGYIGLLFAIAYYGDKRADARRSLINNPYIYALSLAVYCTAWTFYGSVGRAASTGINFLPIYLGPTLMAVVWWFVLRKMIRICKVNRITSLADFIASRYGQSSLLGGLVAVMAVVSIIPYISLQLKAISVSYDALRQAPDIATAAGSSLVSDTAFYVALLLAAFTILFGTRHLDITEHHEGLVVAIAFESLVKLLAFLAVGVYVTFSMFGGFESLFAQAATQSNTRELLTMQTNPIDWAWLIFVSMLAIVMLPRQFQMGVVENVNEDHLSKAMWLFPLYLLVINIFVLPIAIAGLLRFPDGSMDPDMFVLTLPMLDNQWILALFVFIGGLSAAMAMVVVSTVALTTMISNNLVIPSLLYLTNFKIATYEDISWLVLTIRRTAIVVILLLSYVYFRVGVESQPLVSIGLISFVGVAQFAPALLGGIYWKGGTQAGAFAGLWAGFLVFAYTLPLPGLVESGFMPASFITEGPWGLSWLKPYELFGLSGWTPVSHAMFWSMLFNIGGYVVVSLMSPAPSAMEQSQAARFVDVFSMSSASEGRLWWRGQASVAVLRSLLKRFVGPQRMLEMGRLHGIDWAQLDTADANLVDFAEKQLAGTIGSTSARVLIASAVKEEPLGVEEMMNILDETSQVIAYSRQIEQKSRELEAATTELRAANERLQELDRMKDDFLSTVTHELRTPLTSIRAFSEILTDNPTLEIEQRSKFLLIILKESERLTRLINDVLDLAKFESGQMEWHLTELDLRTVIRDTVTSTEQLMHDKHIRLTLTLVDDLPCVLADYDRIMQVMLNLVSNAIKFCDPDAGKIAVRLCRVNGMARIDVADNGMGIRKEHQALIFDKFRQVGETMTSKPQGTGLGLPICKHIITQMGGQLWVESEFGHGSTFSFTLPYVNTNGTLKD